MKAVILAAGMGTRLRPITDSVPKCMVKVHGVTIIENQINNLLDNGINEILVIGGYKYDILKDHVSKLSDDVRIINNKEYAVTNNMYSLNMAKEFVDNEDFLLLNGDVFFEGEIIDRLINDSEPNMIVCDDGRYIEESMKIIIKNGRIASISKQIIPEDAYGVTIDIYKFSSDASKKLFDTIHKIIFEDKNVNSWSEVAIDKILKHVYFVPLNIKNKWVEIDNHEDLAEAEKLF